MMAKDRYCEVYKAVFACGKLRAGIVGDAGWLGNVSLGQNFHPAGGQFVKAPDDA
jgi:hypothetical protein